MNNNTQYYQLNNKREIQFIHPGIILNNKILKARKISRKKLASGTNIPYEIVKDICRGKRNIDRKIGRKLSSYFQVNKDFWINLQNHYDSMTQLINFVNRYAQSEWKELKDPLNKCKNDQQFSQLVEFCTRNPG